MGFKLFDDKIAVPTHSVGVITLPASVLTIAGQQYNVGALTRTISSDVTMIANTLYFVYAQIVSGVVVLRISASAPSAYVISNPLSKLVAAFYANGQASVAWGSFVNIYGPPESSWIPLDLAIKGSVSDPTLGTVSLATVVWKRKSDDMLINGSLTGASGTAGSGNYILRGPTIYSWDTTKNVVAGSQSVNGYWRGYSATGAFYIDGQIKLVNSPFFGLYFIKSNNDNATGSGEQPTFTSADYRYGWEARGAITGWSNTQLVDL